MNEDEAGQDGRITQIVDQFVQELQLGKSIDPREWVQKYPDLKSELEPRLKIAIAVSEGFRYSLGDTLPYGPSVTEKLNCPHCGDPIEFVNDNSDLQCRSCGSSFAITSEQPPATQEAQGFFKRFQLLKRLGRGAFGVVYKARDTRLNRIVAIKIPRSGSFQNRQQAASFLHEAQSAAGLHHPNLVAVYEVGAPETPFIVSQYVDGGTLRQRTETPLDFRSLVQIALKVGQGLQYAHSMDVIHRDIKLNNILIDQNDNPLLTDFGLAKDLSSTITVTQKSEVIGTPAYMAPEQAAAKLTDKRSDIYSLGVVLYRMICGKLPFRGTAKTLMDQVKNDDPQPPCEINDRIPKDLETIILKAMAKAPERRFQTVQEFMDELQLWLDGKPILSRPPSPVERMTKWCRRRPAVSGLLGTLAVLAMVIVGGTTAWGVREASLAYNSQTQLAATMLERGLSEATEHNTASSLPPLVEALKLQESLKDKNGKKLTRQRLELSLRELPRLSLLDDLEDKIDALEFTSDGDRLYVASGLQITCYETESWSVTDRFQLATRAADIAISPDGTRLVVQPDATGNEAVANAAKGIVNAAELWDINSAEQLVLLNHDGHVTSAAFSSDGSAVITTAIDHSARVWNSTTGQLNQTLSNPHEVVTNSWSSPDGQQLVVQGLDFSNRNQPLLRIYDTNNWAQFQDISSLQYVTDVVFHNGLLTVSNKGQIHRYPLDESVPSEAPATGELLAETPLNMRSAFLAAEGILVTKADQETLVWNLDKNTRRFPVSGLPESQSSDAFSLSSDGSFFATVTEQETVAFRWTDNGRNLCDELPQSDGVEALCIRPGGRHVAVGGVNGILRIWDLAGTTRFRQRLASGIRAAHTPRISPSGQIMIASVHPNLHAWKQSESTFASDPTWSVAATSELTDVEKVSQTWALCRFDRSGNTIASVDRDGQLKIFNSADGAETASFVSEQPIRTLEFSRSEDDLLVIGLKDGSVLTWDVTQTAPVPAWEHNSAVGACAFHPGGDLIATGADDEAIILFRKSANRVTQTNLKVPGSVKQLEFSADGNLLLACDHHTATVWNWRQEKQVHQSSIAGEARAMFSADGHFLFAPTAQGMLGRWKIGSDASPMIAQVPQNVHSIKLHPEGDQLLISGASNDTADGFIALFDAQTLELTSPIATYAAYAQCAVSSDGRFILASSWDGTVDLIRMATTNQSISQLTTAATLYSSIEYKDGQMRTLDAKELKALFESTRKQSDWLTQASQTEIDEWQKLKNVQVEKLTGTDVVEDPKP